MSKSWLFKACPGCKKKNLEIDLEEKEKQSEKFQKRNPNFPDYRYRECYKCSNCKYIVLVT